MIFVLLLFLPFELDSIGHWEEWVFRAFLEGRPSRASVEVGSRFWLLVPHVLANFISYGSFSGYHILNILMFWSKLLFCYVILRQLTANSFCAFLCTMLFMVYPVTAGSVSLRFFLMQFRIMSLFAMVCIALAYHRSPSRLRLAGIWMAALLNVGSYESAYAIIAVIPILWWRTSPRWTWRNKNMTLIWMLFPAAKVAYVLLLNAVGREFYGSMYVRSIESSAPFEFQFVSYYMDFIFEIYRQTFWYGWREALTAAGEYAWMVPITATLGLVAVVAAYLARNDAAIVFLSPRKTGLLILSGLLFILPSVGVLMLIPNYAYDLRQLYIFVPIGAAIASFGFFMLMVLPIRTIRLRKSMLTLLCLLALFPSLSRLFVQQSHYVNSADAKAKVLLQIVEQAPSLDSKARLMLVTDMAFNDLDAAGIRELFTNMFDSAVFMLYQEVRPKVAFLCVLGERCSTDDIDVREKYLKNGTDYSDFVMFRLYDDLSVELLRELPPELDDGQNDTYDPEPLIDASAPIPPRALTMLASARRLSTDS